MFTLKGNAVTDPDLKANINGNTLSEVESVYVKWTAKVGDILRKCVRLSLFVKKLRRLSTPTEFSPKFVETFALPLILYCSPAIFPGLLKHDFAMLRCSI